MPFDDVVYGGPSLGRVTPLGGEDHLGLNMLDLVRPRSSDCAAQVLDRVAQGDDSASGSGNSG